MAFRERWRLGLSHSPLRSSPSPVDPISRLAAAPPTPIAGVGYTHSLPEDSQARQVVSMPALTHLILLRRQREQAMLERILRSRRLLPRGELKKRTCRLWFWTGSLFHRFTLGAKKNKESGESGQRFALVIPPAAPHSGLVRVIPSTSVLRFVGGEVVNGRGDRNIKTKAIEVAGTGSTLS
jgi:hypothetical protein